jgi:hypothetical protein
MYKKDITVYISSCWRFNLLKKTIFSLWNNIELDKYNKIITEDSINIKHINKIKKAEKYWFLKWWDVIFTNWLWQHKALEKWYNKIKSKYIFHCEDDWYFKKVDYDIFEVSVNILEKNKNIWIVLLRDFEKDWGLNKINTSKTNRYKELFIEKFLIESWVKFAYANNTVSWDWWNWFSYNPWMRRADEMKKIIFWYENYVNEFAIGERFKKLWLISINLENWIVTHIWNSFLSTRFKSLFDKWFIVWIRKVIIWTLKYRIWLLSKYLRKW